MNIYVELNNPFFIIFFVGIIFSFFINHFLEFIDYKARKKNGGTLPKELQDVPLATETFDTEKLKNISEYENAKYFFWIPSSICSFVLTICLILFGFYPFIFNVICSFAGFPSSIFSSFLCFFLFMVFASIPDTILEIPFSLIKQFKLEKKFGFNTMTLKLWVSDFIKDGIISLILSALLSFVASIFFIKCSNSWWFILATVMILFTFLLQVIYPKFIAPLFNKFSPLEDGSLKDKITNLLQNSNFVSDGVFIMDASKRSKHSNAYFTGFGKSKRIVLYDTLVKTLSEDELVAVLAHELGHFKLKHIIKRLFFVIPLEFVVMFILYKLAQSVQLYAGFGFNAINIQNVSQVQFVGLFLAVIIYSSVSELISPFASFSSRKHEYQADNYAAKITQNPMDLINALIKLNSENLSELLPPKLYVFWNYSHPTIVQRVVALKKEIKK